MPFNEEVPAGHCCCCQEGVCHIRCDIRPVGSTTCQQPLCFAVSCATWTAFLTLLFFALQLRRRGRRRVSQITSIVAGCHHKPSRRSLLLCGAL